ncbi:Cochaperone protein [Ancistrocladus abbreviatus]
MASDLEKKAKEACIDDHFELAVDLYSQAIDLNPNSAQLFADRAQANIKLNNFTEAIADSNRAIELDPSMAKAYFRKGTACIKLEEYHTAKAALQAGASLAPGDSRFTNLIKECDECIAEENGTLPGPSAEKAPKNSATAVPANNAPSFNSLPSSVLNVASSKPKIRHEFYQKPDEVVVTIFAKGIPAENVSVDYGEQILSVTIDVPGEERYSFQPRLFGKIVPSKCRYEMLSTKIEIRLAKAEPISWTSLEFSKGNIVPQRINVSSATHRPAYPSSKPKAVDWDKLEAEVKKEEKEERLDGDAGLNKFFQDIFIGADEDTRRAMCKSFVESNGTVLSTNWKEVGAKKVEGRPPDGMEMKKWEF